MADLSDEARLSRAKSRERAKAEGHYPGSHIGDSSNPWKNMIYIDLTDDS